MELQYSSHGAPIIVQVIVARFFRALDTRSRLAEAQLDETRGAKQRRTVEVVAERLPIEAGAFLLFLPVAASDWHRRTDLPPIL
jgi:hypothetical protein